MERRLAAVLSADVSGYSRLMGQDEAGTLRHLKRHLDESLIPLIAQHQGRVVKLIGDGVLAEFPSVVEAVSCAVDIQTAVAARNAGVPESERILFRIGVNLGDVIVEDDDIYGDGVNVAARLEGLAEPGGICVRSAVCEEVRDKLPYGFEDLGEIEVKNIARPIHAFRVRPEAGRGAPPPRSHGRGWIRPALGLAALAVAAALGFATLRGTGDGDGRATGPVAAAAPSVAVMPFTNLGGDAEEDYFADGLTDDLITDLSKIAGLAVIARSCSFSFKGRPVPLSEIARELGTRYVVEGSVRRAGGMLRINVQLADATSGRQI